MDIFEPREGIYPLEYPQFSKYMDAIHEAFWTAEHFTYDRDVTDFKVRLKPYEQEVVKRAMLAISVVENKVKTFWSRLDMRIPKAEIADVGHTFGGNEVIHKLAYERLLLLLGLQNEFEKIEEIPAMQGRISYLNKYLKGINSRSNKEFTKSLILFTLLVENVSLFSQFLIVASFNKHKNVLGNFNSVINATAREENIHATFGAELIKAIKSENPEWFDDEMEEKIVRSVKKAYWAECDVLDWMFEKGELEFLSKEVVQEYLKFRCNKSLTLIGYEPLFEIDETLKKESDFFDRMTTASISFDFFDSKSTDYSETNKITEEAWGS
jgi:ribonucleoside-diphosphate reductase beta chain|tara:strand:+ start:2661 stop:3635 length:975 start_codon:yes stop_codon:yes gene_type:complete